VSHGLTLEQGAVRGVHRSRSRAGAGVDVAGAVFVYVEESARTVRYEIDGRGRLLRSDTFARDSDSAAR
jgi:hypothetical protein